MPSYVNIGADVDSYTMVDTWATVGSCAQIGKHVHLSGGVGIGGVLEPVQAAPVIIEDNCFIGGNTGIYEGVIVQGKAVIAAGTPLLYDAENGVGWTDPQGWQVYLGTDPADIDLKLAEYQVIVADLLQRNLQTVLINLEYLHAPYYRMEH